MTGNAKQSWVALGNEQHLILCKINVWINSVEFIELAQHSKTWKHWAIMSIIGQPWVTVAKVRFQSLMQFHLVSSIYHFN